MAEKIIKPVEEQTVKSGGNNRMIVIALVLILVVVTGGVVFMIMSKKQSSSPAKVEYTAPTEAPTPTVAPEEAAITSGASEDIEKIDIESPDSDITGIQKDVEQL